VVPREDASTADRAALLARRGVNGGDYWATADGRWNVGTPFSTLACGLMLAELGLDQADPVARAIADTLLACQTEDGRIRPGPHLSVQPCHTAEAARLLCHLGLADDARLDRTFDHLLTAQAADGGWRCKVLKFGAGPDTDASNPGTTLAALDVLRFRTPLVTSLEAERAVDNLLDHWTVRRPLGPCRYGIGSRFMQVEFPMVRYNLFFYVYVLSFYPRARRHTALGAAIAAFQGKLVDGQLVVEHGRPALKELSLCRPGGPNPWATRRYAEIIRNLER
jgi:hypothetical protein